MNPQHHSNTYFISDSHLGATYVSDHRSHELRMVALLRKLAPTARRIYLLGDIMDYWFEYRTVAPRGHVRFLGALAELADSGIEITWIAGNHDSWMRDYLSNELGITVSLEPYITTDIDGTKFVLTHGDIVGPVGSKYRALYTILHNPVARALYAAVHPRWTAPLARYMSGASRRSRPPVTPDWRGDDNEPIYIFARELAHRPDAPRFVIAGHRHLPVQRNIPDTDTQLTILGDCIEVPNYAVFDGKSVTLHTLTEHNDIRSS